MKINWKKAAPYLVALGIFIILPLIYASPVLDGMVINQGDIIKYKGMSKELQDYKEAHGDVPRWTGRAFSGMPTFTISAYFDSSIGFHLQSIFYQILPHPAGMIFMLLIGFYILLLAFKVDPWLAIIGAIGFAFSSNFLISIDAGHNSKVMSIALMPAFIAGIIWVFNKKYLIGSIITVFFGTVLIAAGHFQIVFYALLVALIVGIAYLVKAIKEKEIKEYLKAVGVLAIAAVLAAIPNFSYIYNTYVHSQETMRGAGSELKDEEERGGLDIGYALNDWSFGVKESFTLMFPFFESGSSMEEVEPGSPIHEAFQRNISRTINEPLRAPLYTGPQRFTSPIYIGASILFLFFIGIFLVKGINKYWIAAAAVLSLFIAWGSHFEAFNSFLFYNFPLFNKFRNPAMALCIIGMAAPLLGFLALNKFLPKNPSDPEPELMNALKLGSILTAVFFAIAVIIGMSSDFMGTNPANTQTWVNSYADQIFQGQEMQAQAQNFKVDLLNAIQETREQFFWNSIIRSLIIILIIASLLFFYIKGKVRSSIVLIGIGVIVTYDVWSISRRYMNDESFVDESVYEKPLQMTGADQVILQDKDLSYRVLNLTGGVFSDGITPYYHKSVLGYSAAKLQVYQDLIENQLGQEVQRTYQLFSNAQSQEQLDQEVKNQLPVLNMLNTRYIILSPQAQGVYRNPNALGNAWFVQNLQPVQSAQEEMNALAQFNPATTALIRQENMNGLQQSYPVSPDATIQLTEYAPETLKYQSRSASPGFAVFSEVYYATGWNAYIDGNKVPIHKVNYALRGIEVPAGEHEIIMAFEPESIKLGDTVSLAGSILFVIFIAGLLFYKYREEKKGKHRPNEVYY